MAAALTHNSSLETLDLRSNPIKREGVSAFAEALRSNTSLTYLYLNDNEAGDVPSLGIEEALSRNQQMRT